jgi:alkylhydroperoxidase family enzyme
MTEEMVAALADFEKGDFTPRETLALRFATLMAQDHHKLDDAFFGTLRQQFTDAEIIELGMVTGQFIGFGRLIAALDLENPSQPEG